MLVAVTALAALVNAQEYTYSYRTIVSVTTSYETFAPTGAVDVYFMAYPKAVITVIASNPGTSAAGIKITWDCLGGGSATFTVPAGGVASYPIVLNIPSPPTSYIACHITANVSNITGIGLVMFYEANVRLLYNKTTATYVVPLFTEPYYAVGGVNRYFRFFLVYPVHGVPPSGYSVLLNLNTSLSTSYSDSAIVENSKSLTQYGIMLNITDTAAATGRYLGEVNITYRLPRSINLVITPVRDRFISGADLVAENVSKIYVLMGEHYLVALPNKSIVFSGSTPYYVNYSVVKIISVEPRLNMVEKESSIGGVNVYEIGTGVFSRVTRLEVLALVRDVLAGSTWYEPVFMNVTVVPVPVTVNVTYPSVSLFRNVTYVPAGAVSGIVRKNNTFTANVTVVDLSSYNVYYVKPHDEGIVVRALIDKVDIVDYALALYYVATESRSGTIVPYINATDIAPVKQFSSIITSVRDGVPIVNLTLIATGGKYGHIAFYVPYNVKLSVTKIAPIRSSVTLEAPVDLGSFRMIVETDALPNGHVRTLRTPSDVSVSSLMPGVYVIDVPFTYNATPFLVDTDALLVVKVTWLDGSPAAGITVSLYRGSTLVAQTVTDRDGVAVFYPFYDVYLVKACTTVHGVPVTTSRDVTLSDDTVLTLQMPINKPKPEVMTVTITAPATAYVNKSFIVLVTSRLNIAPDSEVRFSGKLTCVGPVTVEKTFTVTFNKGQVETTVPVKVALPKTGVYTCSAAVGGVTSNTAVVTAKPYNAVTALIENMPLLHAILVILAIIVLLAIVGFVVGWLYRRRTPSLRIRIE